MSREKPFRETYLVGKMKEWRLFEITRSRKPIEVVEVIIKI
jgi:hypothetical protein